jgi:hypothetical protein
VKPVSSTPIVVGLAPLVKHLRGNQLLNQIANRAEKSINPNFVHDLKAVSPIAAENRPFCSNRKI